ncbi:O-antigen ligase family protein [Streptococcus suis]
MILLRSEVSTVPFLNANIYGLCTFFSAVGFLYLYMTREKKIVNLLLMLLMLGLSVLTGSRKVLMLCLIIVLGTYVFSNLKSSIYRVIILLSILCGFYILVMHNNFLYTIIGVRIEETLNFFTDQGVASNTSTGIRNSMIKLGYQLFRLKPLIGYGVMGTYTYNNGTYLHNNYFELLVNTGLIGTIIYYFPHTILLFKNIKTYLGSANFKTLFYLLLMVAIVIMDYSLVSYNERIILILLILAGKVYDLNYLEWRFTDEKTNKKTTKNDY